MKLKRTSENQITKDTYDRGEEDSRFAEEPDPGTGMKRAPDDVIKGRKIIRASRKFAATSSSAPSKAPATNALTSTKLVANDAPPPPSPSNPFAAVQLKSGTAAPPSFSFGAAQKTEPKPFSFGPSSSQQQSSSKATSSSSLSSKSKANNDAKIKEINSNFFRMIQDHAEKGHICCDLAPLMEQYIDIVDNLQSDEEDDDGDGNNNDGENGQNSSGSAFSAGSSNNDENKSFSGFSFASSSAPPLSSGGTTFSFTGSSAPSPAEAPVASTFSFGAQPAAPRSGGSNNTANEDDPTSNPDDGKLDIGQEENEDEETLYEVRARLLRMSDKGWNKQGTGALRLYRNKTSDNKKMVLRNGAGKVMFNVAVSKGMKFQKVSHQKKGGKDIWFVHFLALEDAHEGPKPVRLNVGESDIGRLHEELEKLAAV
ncbi:hypothetical protein ACHAWT_002268 [Skeletonema menzelii]